MPLFEVNLIGGHTGDGDGIGVAVFLTFFLTGFLLGFLLVEAVVAFGEADFETTG
jgi:hypothetical protein